MMNKLKFKTSVETKMIIAAFFGMTIPALSIAQTWPGNITYVAAAPNDSVIIEGNLSKGKIISDLSWASNSSNACFTAVQFPKFQGNHVLYRTVIPAGAMIKIKISPANIEEELSLYGYMINSKENFLVPDLPRCITCEADYKRDRPVRGKVPSNDREIEFRNPTNSTYNIIIGVSAPDGVTERKFRLMVKTAV